MCPITVFCDESGFTGEYLLDRRQRFFSYASVAIDKDEVRDIAAEVRTDFRVQGDELKGRNLLKYSNGRKAIFQLINAVGSRAQLVVHHKEYALATKFFEYAFEPLVSDVNSVFYAIDFHKFIGNLLYLNVFLRQERAVELSGRFQEAVRGDDLRLRQIATILSPNTEDPIEQVISFCVYNRDSILRELEAVRQIGGWLVELTSTSLWSLLAYWGDRHDSLQVVCDQSVPLHTQREFFNMMVGRTDKARIKFGTRSKSVIFNLAAPMELVDSSERPGVQIADVLAATLCAAMEQPKDPWFRGVLQRFFELGVINDDCIHPELDQVDLRTKKASVNCVLLLELVQRSSKGMSLTDGIVDFIRAAYETFPSFEQRELKYDLLIAGGLESSQS
jgi:hypothetical protein